MLDKTFAFLQARPEMWADDQMRQQALVEVKGLRSLPEIVCLCGSSRFVTHFIEENNRLTLAGCIVLNLGVFGKEADDPNRNALTEIVTPDQKALLDALHFRKIELSGRIHVLNIEGYIGKSTFAEVRRAHELGKPISFAVDHVKLFGAGEPMSIRAFMDAIQHGRFEQ